MDDAITSSMSPRLTTRREWPLSRISATIRAGSSAGSSQTMSGRGVMIERTVRSARRRTASIIRFSSGSKTPESVPSAMRLFTSSSVTVCSRSPFCPSRRRIALVERPSSQTIG